MNSIMVKIAKYIVEHYFLVTPGELIAIYIEEFLNTFEKKSDDVNEITDNIDEITQKLNDSKVLIDSTLAEMEKQKVLLKDIKEKAEENKALAQINQTSADAIKESLKRELEENDKKNKKETIAWNLFFCILSAIIGFALGKIF